MIDDLEDHLEMMKLCCQQDLKREREREQASAMARSEWMLLFTAVLKTRWRKRIFYLAQKEFRDGMPGADTEDIPKRHERGTGALLLLCPCNVLGRSKLERLIESRGHQSKRLGSCARVATCAARGALGKPVGCSFFSSFCYCCATAIIFCLEADFLSFLSRCRLYICLGPAALM